MIITQSGCHFNKYQFPFKFEGRILSIDLLDQETDRRPVKGLVIFSNTNVHLYDEATGMHFKTVQYANSLFVRSPRIIPSNTRKYNHPGEPTWVYSFQISFEEGETYCCFEGSIVLIDLYLFLE